MSTTAIIVARANSRRLPGKALLPFGDSTLIGHKIATLKQCVSIDRVVVGSDSTSILSEALCCGADIVHRDDYHCDESRCSANEMLRDMASKVSGDLIVWAHPTNPLVKASTYDAAVQAYLDGVADGYDSLCSVRREQRHAWIDGKPFNFNPWQARHPFAKELKPIDFQDGAIFIQPREQMLGNSYFYGRNPVLFPIAANESTDIDNADDYRLACAMWSVAEDFANRDASLIHSPVEVGRQFARLLE